MCSRPPCVDGSALAAVKRNRPAPWSARADDTTIRLPWRTVGRVFAVSRKTSSVIGLSGRKATRLGAAHAGQPGRDGEREPDPGPVRVRRGVGRRTAGARRRLASSRTAPATLDELGTGRRSTATPASPARDGRGAGDQPGHRERGGPRPGSAGFGDPCLASLFLRVDHAGDDRGGQLLDLLADERDERGEVGVDDAPRRSRSRSARCGSCRACGPARRGSSRAGRRCASRRPPPPPR